MQPRSRSRAAAGRCAVHRQHRSYRRKRHASTTATRITATEAEWADVGGHSTTTSFTEQFSATATPTTNLYRVRSGVTVNGTDVKSGPSSLGYATVATALFSDEPLVVRNTRIRGAHMGELRRAIDAVRRAAELDPAWSSYGALTGTVAAGENLEARAKLDEAVFKLVGHNVPYTGETPASRGTIWAYQYQQIRDGVR